MFEWNFLIHWLLGSFHGLIKSFIPHVGAYNGVGMKVYFQIANCDDGISVVKNGSGEGVLRLFGPLSMSRSLVLQEADWSWIVNPYTWRFLQKI